ncbi:hypothetical protein [Arthrobacter sp. C152]
MTLAPLPVPTRLTHGEGIDNYASRHAQRNGTTVEQIEKALREAGILPPSRSRRHPERIQAWKQLGKLDVRAFDQRSTLHGHPILERALCLRCAAGTQRVGRTLTVGWVCIAHRRWIGHNQLDIRELPELLAAERHFRSTLVSRGAHVGTPVMVTARECARAGITLSTLEERTTRAGTYDPEMLTYPETIKIARLITQTSFKNWFHDPAHPPEQQRDRMAREIASSIIPTGENRRLRSAERIEKALRKLSRLGINWMT